MLRFIFHKNLSKMLTYLVKPNEASSLSQLESAGAGWSQPEPAGASWSRLELAKAGWSQLEPAEAGWSQLEPNTNWLYLQSINSWTPVKTTFRIWCHIWSMVEQRQRQRDHHRRRTKFAKSKRQKNRAKNVLKRAKIAHFNSDRFQSVW